MTLGAALTSPYEITMDSHLDSIIIGSCSNNTTGMEKEGSHSKIRVAITMTRLQDIDPSSCHVYVHVHVHVLDGLKKESSPIQLYTIYIPLCHIISLYCTTSTERLMVAKMVVLPWSSIKVKQMRKSSLQHFIFNFDIMNFI